MLGFDPQRQFAGEIVAHSVVEVGVGVESAASQDAEHAPHAGVAAANRAEIERAVGLAERELLVRAVEEAPLTGEGDDIGSIESLRIVQRETGDAGLVRVSADVAVGDAAGHPHDAAVVRSLADEVHHPGLGLVYDAEGLAFRSIAVFICKAHDDLYRLPGRPGAFEGHVDEAAVVHDGGGVHQFQAASPGGLADCDLVHVHIAYALEGERRLRNLPEGLGAVPFDYLPHRPFGVTAALQEIQFTEEPVGICRVRHHRAAVGTRSGGDYYIRAGIGPASKNCRGHNRRRNCQ